MLKYKSVESALKMIQGHFITQGELIMRIGIPTEIKTMKTVAMTPAEQYI